MPLSVACSTSDPKLTACPISDAVALRNDDGRLVAIRRMEVEARLCVLGEHGERVGTEKRLNLHLHLMREARSRYCRWKDDDMRRKAK